jgi:tripartite-type tricarboxylate transporter receptor subunit TctC
MRKIFTQILFLATILFGASAHAAYPEKPIRIVIGFSAGGPLDLHARLLSEKLQSELGQTVIVDYKPGAGGSLGAQEVMNSKADGYTIMLANTGVMVINPAIYKQLPYLTLRDFVPLARTAMQPLALLVNPKLPIYTVKELIAYAKANPGKLNYGSAGNGGISHLVPEMFKSATGIQMEHIPYKGSAPAFTDLMAGQVQFMAESIPQAATYHKQEKVRAIAVTSRTRSPVIPDVPTVIESGVKGFEVVGFYGFLAPKGTPKEVVDILSKAFDRVLAQPEIREKMVSQGADPAYMNSADFSKFLKDQTPRWAEAVKKSGAKLD